MPMKTSQTNIVTTTDTLESPYPHCVLPRFERSVSGGKQPTLSVEKLRMTDTERPRSPLTISTWDGKRNIMEVLPKE